PTAASSTLLLSPASHRTCRSFPTRRSSDLPNEVAVTAAIRLRSEISHGSWSKRNLVVQLAIRHGRRRRCGGLRRANPQTRHRLRDRKSTRLNSSHGSISYAVFCFKKKSKGG